jgi:7-cyano-7-deazaguanine synthase in queuosine biosynthesis
VHLPVSPAFVPLAPRLAQLLNFLTGDNWTVKARETNLDLGLKGNRPHAWRPDAVMLFSGGLDSLVGALDRLEAGQRLFLLSHYDFGQLAAIQQTLAAALTQHYGSDRVHHLGLRVQFSEAPELSLRSRSLLYLALGLAAAAAWGPSTPLIIPENGWISLNPPLTWNRLGSCSTRTTHPEFLEQLTGLWRAAGLENPLINPYQEHTKGEMVRRCRNQATLRRLFPLSVSCARPVVSRWQGGAAGACGYCYPCLMRRAALHAQGWDEGGDYLRDVLSDPENLAHRIRGRDLRALLLAHQTWEDAPQEIEARLLLGAAPEAMPARWAQARQVLDRGFEEIGVWLRDKGPEWVQAYGT